MRTILKPRVSFPNTAAILKRHQSKISAIQKLSKLANENSEFSQLEKKMERLIQFDKIITDSLNVAIHDQSKPLLKNVRLTNTQIDRLQQDPAAEFKMANLVSIKRVQDTLNQKPSYHYSPYVDTDNSRKVTADVPKFNALMTHLQREPIKYQVNLDRKIEAEYNQVTRNGVHPTKDIIPPALTPDENNIIAHENTIFHPLQHFTNQRRYRELYARRYEPTTVLNMELFSSNKTSAEKKASNVQILSLITDFLFNTRVLDLRVMNNTSVVPSSHSPWPENLFIIGLPTAGEMVIF